MPFSRPQGERSTLIHQTYSLLSGFEAGNFLQCGTEPKIIHFYAVVKVDGELFLREREEDVAFIILQFGEHGGILVDPLALDAEFGHEFAQIVVEDDADGIGAVAMQIDERVERPFGRGEQPVDRAFLVPLDMLLVKILHEIFADILADGFFDESEIAGECLLAERELEEILELRDDVIDEPFVIEDGENAVAIGEKAGANCLLLILFFRTRPDFGDVVVEILALIGEDQAGLFERVTPHHAADGVRDELFDRIFQQPLLSLMREREVSRRAIRLLFEGWMNLSRRNIEIETIAEQIRIFGRFTVSVPWITGQGDLIP